jgi:hypothetical protein
MKSMAEDEVEEIKHEIDNMKLAVCLILINQIRFSPNLKQFTTLSGCHEQTLCDKKFNATFNNTFVFHGSQFYWWRKLAQPRENH